MLRSKLSKGKNRNYVELHKYGIEDIIFDNVSAEPENVNFNRSVHFLDIKKV